MTRER